MPWELCKLLLLAQWRTKSTVNPEFSCQPQIDAFEDHLQHES
ncbi:unnamed protein product [Musa acuminata subsp. burmannicoides]